METKYESLTSDAELRSMRQESPVHFDEEYHGWRVLRYPDVRRVLADHDTFSSALPWWDPAIPLMLLSDPPGHTTLRRFAEPAFHSVRDLAASVEANVDRMLGPMIEQGEADLVELAKSVPARTVAKLLGFPDDDEELFYSLVAQFDTGRVDDFGPIGEFAAYVNDHCEAVRKHPRNDMLSALVAAADLQGMAQGDINGICMLVIGAGVMTTRHLLTWFFVCATPHDLNAIRADFGLLPGAIEETLRFRPPQSTAYRIARRAITVGEQDIPEGALILPSIMSANHDEDVFAASGQFDIRRHPNPHLAFGAGIHSCLGSGLARLEARITLRAVLERTREVHVPDVSKLELVAGLNYGVASLPVTFVTQGGTA